MARQYEPAWIELKKKGMIRLAVPAGLHRRVIKAILKEKYLDVGYRFEMLEQRVRLRIEYRSQGNVVYMYLIKSPTFLSSITAADL